MRVLRTHAVLCETTVAPCYAIAVDHSCYYCSGSRGRFLVTHSLLHTLHSPLPAPRSPLPALSTQVPLASVPSTSCTLLLAAYNLLLTYRLLFTLRHLRVATCDSAIRLNISTFICGMIPGMSLLPVIENDCRSMCGVRPWASLTDHVLICSSTLLQLSYTAHARTKTPARQGGRG